MTSITTFPPPLNRLESQPDNLMGSSDPADVAELFPSKMNGHQDEFKAPVSNGPDSTQILTGTEKEGALPPLQIASKKNNKGVAWYESRPCNFLFAWRYRWMLCAAKPSGC